jgi:general stress protein YciG
MDPERQREIASKGGRAAHESGHAHEWDSEEASEAAQVSHGERAAFHHESAAHHHTQAGRYRASGQHGLADLHAEHARRHGRQADDYGERASHSSNRGFAAMDPERQREIASMGGHASHGGRGRDYEGEEWESEGQSGRGNSSRGGSRQQHAEAGRRGAEARWGEE